MATDIDDLQIKIKASASSSYKPIENLVKQLEKLSSAIDVIDANRFSTLANSLDRFGASVKTLSGVKTSDFTRISKNLEKLANLNYPGLNASANGLFTISNAISGLNITNGNVDSISRLASAISRLGYRSVDRAVQNMPQLTSEIATMITTVSRLPSVNQSIIDYTNALANLSSQGSRFSSASRTIDRSLNSNSVTAKNTSKSFDGLASAFGKFYATYFLLIRGAKSVWGNIESSMDYVETSNYFSVALGQIGQQFEEAGYETADLYTKALSSELNKLNKKLTGYSVGKSGEALLSNDIGLGMDIEQMMNFQAKTLAVTNSVGLMGEASLGTAKAVSMLAGDLSSLTNTDLESVMEHLSSGLIGQSRVLYRYGIDITQNTLQQYALAEGIEKSVAEMTQAEKMQLRLLAILDQSTVAQTDLANTINSVANQYRTFEQQTDNLGRTIGNLFLPIVQNVLPYVNGLVIALNNLFTTLGFDLYGDTWLENLQQGISGGTIPDDFDEIGESADDATESINSFKKGLRGFDELNVITSGTKIGVGTMEELESQIDLTDSIMKSVANYESAWDEAFATAENKASEFAKKLTEDFGDVADIFESILPAITGIGGALATYKIATGIGGIVSSLGALGSPVGVAALAAGVLVGVGTAIKQVHDNAVEADLEKRFGNISLSMEDIDMVARNIIDNGNLTMLSKTLSEIGEIEDIESSIKKSVDELDRLNWKVSIGMELTEKEQGQYKDSIDSYVKNSQDYVEQMQYSTIVGIELFIEDSQTSQQIQSVVNEFYGEQSEKLRKLGEDLNRVTTEAWNDGLLTIDEVQTITNIQMQMAEIQKQFTNSEFQARLQILEAEYSGAELTPESYEELKKKRQELIDQYTEDYNESLVFTLAQVNIAYQAKFDAAYTKETKERIKEEWDNAIKELQEGRDLQISQMALQSLSFDYNTLIDTFGEDMDSAFNGVTQNLAVYARKFSEEADWAEQGVADLMTRLVQRFKKEAGVAGQENFKAIIENMMPTQDIEELAESFYNTSGEIPQAIADALVSQYSLNALNGSLDAMYKLMLVSADSKDMQAVLEAMNERGMDIPQFLADGVISNTEVATDSLTDMLDDLGDTMVDTDLVKEAEDLGEQISKNLSKGIHKGMGISGFSAVAFGDITPIGGYASGGIVSSGEVFVARENGIPEMVGSFGNHTAVANNDQIVKGIQEGVYAAVVSALSATNRNSDNSDIVINMDGSEIFKVVRSRANEHFRTTGNPAFDF